MNDADTLHRTYSSAPPVDPPDPLTEPAVEPTPLPPDPFPGEPYPDDPDTPTLPEPEPGPGGMPPSRSPFPMP